MKPHIICHMITSVDGSLHPSRWTKSPDGSRSDWSAAYESVHRELDAQAWMVGRITMAEISKAEPHPPSSPFTIKRPLHIARKDAETFAIALDPHGKLHFAGGDIDGDHIVALLGSHVSDAHLAELAADGVSYIVSDTNEIELAQMMNALGRDFGIRRILLEGGAGINGSFFAAGLVDELSLVLAPALDARKGSDRIIEFGDAGLAGKCELSFSSCNAIGNGLLHLRYKVGG